MEIIGQILGFIAFGLAFLLYQMKSRRSLLIVQTLLVTVVSIHYFCLKAYPAMAMNIFCIARNLIYFRRDIFKWRYTPLVVSIIIMIIGILTSTGVWSILIIVGLTINTYCLSFENPQHFRYSILITSPIVLVYDVIVFSLGGILLEGISIISAIIGMLRNRKK